MRLSVVKPFVGSDRVTAGTHKVALCNFFENGFNRITNCHHVSYVAALDSSDVIELHRAGRKHSSTICAGFGFERKHYRFENVSILSVSQCGFGHVVRFVIDVVLFSIPLLASLALVAVAPLSLFVPSELRNFLATPALAAS